MHHFDYKDGLLHCEGVSLERIASEVGTPAYVYSHATLRRHFEAFDSAFAQTPHLTCFSVKSSSNLSLLKLFASLGGGADIVSGGELFRALKAGVPASRIVYSGVGKTGPEIKAALAAGILMFNVESPQELSLINETAQAMGTRAPVALRVNPDVDPQTHPYISTGLKKNKFGVNIDDAAAEYLRAAKMPGIELIGLDCHIGSQLTQLSPFVDTISRLSLLLDRLKAEGISLKYLDLGGGLGITYDDETPPSPAQYAQALIKANQDLGLGLILEPGRNITGNAGVLLAQVLYVKPGQGKTFVITDAAMNDLMRPTLYDSHHAVWQVRKAERELLNTDVVGPICETGDFLARGRQLPAYEPGELMALMSAGAYGFSMSSNYNSRPRAAEVLVRENEFFVIRRRETYDDLVHGEEIPSFLG